MKQLTGEQWSAIVNAVSLDEVRAIVNQASGPYVSIERHYHVAVREYGKLLDECAYCGLDLRDSIHKRVGE